MIKSDEHFKLKESWRWNSQKNTSQVHVYALQINNNEKGKFSQKTNIFELAVNKNQNKPNVKALRKILSTINVKTYWGMERKKKKTLRVSN